MAVEIINPKTAMEILRKHQILKGKPHNRIHAESMEDTVNRIRALEGICGSCTYLVLERTRDYLNNPRVSLRCPTGYSPLVLYRNTDLGQKPVCPGQRTCS